MLFIDQECISPFCYGSEDALVQCKRDLIHLRKSISCFLDVLRISCAVDGAITPAKIEVWATQYSFICLLLDTQDNFKLRFSVLLHKAIAR